MIKLLGQIPREVWLAFSGGVDSVAIADFLLRGKRQVNLVFVNHGTECSKVSEVFVKKFAQERNCNLFIHRITEEKPKQDSLEEFWRKERYKVFRQYPLVITGHHLDDAVETWLWRCMTGNPRTIAYRNGNVIRPFLLNKKELFYAWAEKHFLGFIEDPSNKDVKFTRNKIRHEITPKVLEVNPGLYKTIGRKILKDFNDLVVENQVWE